MMGNDAPVAGWLVWEKLSTASAKIRKKTRRRPLKFAQALWDIVRTNHTGNSGERASLELH